MMSDAFQIKANQIASRFSALSSFAEKLTFPDYRKGVLEPKDIQNWRGPVKHIFNLSHPFTTTDNLGSLFYLIWVTLYIFGYISFVFGWVLIYPILFNVAPFLPPADASAQVFVVFGLFCTTPVAVVAYFWWIDTLLARKNPWWINLLLIIVVFWSLAVISSAMLAKSPSTSLWENSGETLTILVSFGLFLIPTTSYFWALVYDTLLIVLLILRTLFGGITVIHDPRPIQTIMRLATEEIPSVTPGQPSWKLSDLTRDEINQLRQWAEANREGSEKRTLPTFFIMAVIGLLLTSEFVRSAFDSFISLLISNTNEFINAKSPSAFSLSHFLLLIFTLIVIIVLMDIIKKLLILFRNIVAQNLVVEACIVAESSVEIPQVVQQKQSRWRQIIHLLIR